ncbi:MAG: transketolase family protein [Planctomycetes bacterium]|nr:transketolase family protein [Planctomycetota bacterium]
MTIALRDAYGQALLQYGGPNPDVVVLDADVSASSKSCFFAAAHPERFFNVGIAESNMTGMAAGFASVGKIAFANTFAIFFSTLGLCAARGLVAYTNLNVKLMAAYGGLSDSYDGPSHHAIEDLAIMRALPNMKVFCASDAVMADWLVRMAIYNHGPMYIRLSRDAVPDVHPAGTPFTLGRGVVVRPGDDATVIATGVMVSKALEAAAILAASGISLRVVDMFTIKPLDRELVLACAAETGALVTAEEHSVVGGLGGAVAETLALAGVGTAVEFVGLRDCFAETGPYEQLLHKYGLDGQGIAAAVTRALAKRK